MALALRGHSLLYALILLWTPAIGRAAPETEALIRRNTGLACLERDAYPDALEAFRRVTELAPREPLGYANAGLALLRMRRPDEAETWLRQALARDPGNPQVHLLLAEAHDLQGRRADFARELEEALRLRPGDVRARYRLIRHELGSRPTPAGLAKAEAHARTLRDQLPQNAVVRMRLGEILLRRGDAAGAREVYREARGDLWDVPEDAVSYLEKGLLFLERGMADEALRQMALFENLQKGSASYRSAISELVAGVSGFPLERFGSEFERRCRGEAGHSVPVRFEETDGYGLPEGPILDFSTGDVDGDGLLDLLVLRRTGSPGSGNLLLRNDRGRYRDVTERAGPAIQGEYDGGCFADFDHDGAADLLLWNSAGSVILLRNEEGRFRNVTDRAGLPSPAAGIRAAMSVDYDHDGDLDLFLLRESQADPGARGILLCRNNGDGTFAEIGDRAGLPGTATATAGAFGDFDEDGDTDLLFAGSGGAALYTNLRQGRIGLVPGRGGLPPIPSAALAVADVDNDGFLDVFCGGLYRNRGDGAFERLQDPPTLPDRAPGSACFLDFDNDGWIDLAIADPDSGLRLFRNAGGRLEPAPGRMLAPGGPVDRIEAFDADADGDLDLLVRSGGRLKGYRNEGGNANGWLAVRLAALAVGGGKNNRAGIGAKVEVKAGASYQMRCVTGPVTHFGLGDRTRAEVLRVIWTNGVSQSTLDPEINGTVTETQILKGSCPFLYAWDGTGYRFVTDLLARSMLGTILDDGRRAFADPARDYVRIPGDGLLVKDGSYSLRVTEELWEATYLDVVRLMAVDHPAGTEIYVDERFLPPPFPPFRIHAVRSPRLPVSATDDRGRDVLDRLRARDGRYVDGFALTPFQGIAEPHGLTMDLGRFPDRARVTLFLNGWEFPTEGSINVALSQRTDGLRAEPPRLETVDGEGRWRTVLPFLGFPNGKRKTCVVDLTGKFLSPDHRIRISTNMQVYYDQAFFTVDESEIPCTVAVLPAPKGEIRYRGFSRMYRESPSGPHLFDYDDVSRERRWRDLEGRYTRYGDITPLLEAEDDRCAVLNAGDEVALEFDAGSLPPPREGWKRDFVLYSDGWAKEGDLNTAHSETVSPLPYHGLTAYPYGPGDAYPEDEVHRVYLETYQTRQVTNRAFRDRLKGPSESE